MDLPSTDPDDLPTGWCGHRECPPDDGCLRISAAVGQPTMWCCPVSTCRRALLTVARPGEPRRSYEVVNASLALIGAPPILVPHDCAAYSPN